MPKSKKRKIKQRSLTANDWWSSGEGMTYKREALPLSHPQSWVGLWYTKYGDIKDFPWIEIYGEYPDFTDLVRAGYVECPICGNSTGGDTY
jgi:hypothetical protein